MKTLAEITNGDAQIALLVNEQGEVFEAHTHIVYADEFEKLLAGVTPVGCRWVIEGRDF